MCFQVLLQCRAFHRNSRILLNGLPYWQIDLVFLQRHSKQLHTLATVTYKAYLGNNYMYKAYPGNNYIQGLPWQQLHVQGNNYIQGLPWQTQFTNT